MRFWSRSDCHSDRMFTAVLLKNILKKYTCAKLSVITGPGSGVIQTVSIVVLLRTSRNVPVLTTQTISIYKSAPRHLMRSNLFCNSY